MATDFAQERRWKVAAAKKVGERGALGYRPRGEAGSLVSPPALTAAEQGRPSEAVVLAESVRSFVSPCALEGAG